ncbi:GreA/GreB family elongation factor [Oleiharenicola sp. Vm1]|uniref:GreA/GreB family elongation factor n=1 Tax=Oleiharenicola sp. Vm1 TaxID=3398393 RepID=UPI0039F45943
MKTSPSIHVSSHDHEVLQLLLKSLERQREACDRLRGELQRAVVCDAATLPPGTVGLNSRVRLLDLDRDEVEEYVLTIPAAADPERQRLSVLAPVGTALLGYHVNDEIAWPTPGGTRRLRILAVAPEPPAPASPLETLVPGWRR